jgi:hypothetical protein
VRDDNALVTRGACQWGSGLHHRYAVLGHVMGRVYRLSPAVCSAASRKALRDHCRVGIKRPVFRDFFAQTSLFLVISLKHNRVGAADDESFEGLDGFFFRKNRASSLKGWVDSLVRHGFVVSHSRVSRRHLRRQSAYHDIQNAAAIHFHESKACRNRVDKNLFVTCQRRSNARQSCPHLDCSVLISTQTPMPQTGIDGRQGASRCWGVLQVWHKDFPQ